METISTKSIESRAASVPGHDIIVVGASAGGVEALADLASRLPADLPAAVFVVLHVPAYGTSVLPTILSRRGPLPARHPDDGEEIRRGRVYVAPPDHHLMLRDGRISLTRGPAENGHRPAVDTLFRSAARSYGSRVAGVVLTGALDDGTAGLQAVKMRGGVTLAQDPDEALFASMPRSAIENVDVDFVQPLAEIAATLTRLAHLPASQKGTAMAVNIENNTERQRLETETEIAALNLDAIETPRDGLPSVFSCPDCHGVLWEIREGELTRFRCRVGHAFSPGSLLASQSDMLEEALWVALRALEENAALAERLAERADGRGHSQSAARFGEQAADARHRAAVIRQALVGGQIIANSGPPFAERNER